MACTKTDTKFEQFTTMLASGVSRRDALKWVGAAALGAMLTSVVTTKEAEAQNPCKAGGAICAGNYNPCKSCSSGLGCYCFDHTGKKAFCGQNDFCSNLSTCAKNKDCASGSKCSWQNGCTSCSNTGSGVCLAKCTSCPSGASSVSGKGGKTAAPRG